MGIDDLKSLGWLALICIALFVVVAVVSSAVHDTKHHKTEMIQIDEIYDSTAGHGSPNPNTCLLCHSGDTNNNYRKHAALLGRLIGVVSGTNSNNSASVDRQVERVD